MNTPKTKIKLKQENYNKINREEIKKKINGENREKSTTIIESKNKKEIFMIKYKEKNQNYKY